MTNQTEVQQKMYKVIDKQLSKPDDDAFILHDLSKEQLAKVKWFVESFYVNS